MAAAGSVFFLSPYRALICTAIASLLLYISSVRLLNAGCDRMKTTVVLWFLAYIFFLLDITLLNSEFLRNAQPFAGWSVEAVAEYAKTHLFLHPFDSFKYFIGGYQQGIMSFKWMFLNIIGNFVAFMPFALFIPYLFKHIRSWFTFLIVIALVVTFIETMQLVIMTGYADIDDLILNCSGAMLAYFIVNGGLGRRVKKALHL